MRSAYPYLSSASLGLCIQERKLRNLCTLSINKTKYYMKLHKIIGFVQPRRMYYKHWTVLKQHNSLPAKISTKSDQRFESGFRVNPDPDVCRIAPKMWWIHYLVGSIISPSFVKLAGDCMRNDNKSPEIPYPTMMRKTKK